MSEDLITYKYTDDNGKEVEQMHPKLHVLIWATLMTKKSYCGTEKDKRDVKARFAYLYYNHRNMCQSITIGGDCKDLDTTWKGAEKVDDGYKYYIQSRDIDDYWGLWTNSNYGESFTKFVNQIEKIASKHKI